MCYSSAGRCCVALIIIALLFIGFSFCVFGVFPTREHGPKGMKELSASVQPVQNVFIASGVLALIVCAFSLCGILTILKHAESKCLFYWLALFVVLAIVADIVLIVFMELEKSMVRDFFKSNFILYGKTPKATTIVDSIQKQYQCCGMDGPADYTSKGLPVPESCCPLPERQWGPSYPSGWGGPGQGGSYRTHRARPPRREESPYVHGYDDKQIKRSISNVKNTTSVSLRRGYLTSHEDLSSEEQTDGNYTVNVTGRIEFELPDKNIIDPVNPYPGGNDNDDGRLTTCKGCRGKIPDAYADYYIIFYCMIAAKILLEFAVAVTPCWVMFRDKFDHLGGRRFNEEPYYTR